MTKFTFLTPGTGHFFCGSCLRDHALASALRSAGHEVEVLPLYLPLMLEEPSPEESAAQVHMGGINMYLQQKMRAVRWVPRLLTKMLDAPGLLRWAARRGNLTDASELGAMTLSMLRGEEGRQSRELDQLCRSLGARIADNASTQPHVLVLSNLMLTGTVRRLSAETGLPIIATMQGEAPFLDSLPEPFSTQAWAELRQRASELQGLVAVSESYRATMCAKLELSTQRVDVIYNGLELTDFPAKPTPTSTRQPRRIGYLARMCADKGLDTLAQAFGILKKDPEFADVQLAVCGVQLKEDRAFVGKIQAQLQRDGAAQDVTFQPNVSREEKLAFLQTLTLFSVPATYGESFGLYLLEALAAGVPVVQPDCDAFPEILAATGGGRLTLPNDAQDLASALAELLRNPAACDAMGQAGHAAVHARFQSARMAHDFAEFCDRLATGTEQLSQESDALA